MRLTRSFGYFAAATAFSAAAVAPAGAQLPANGVVSIGKVDSVYSNTLKEQRRFLVYTPPSYGDTTFLPRRYPVLYLLDGDAHFHSVTGLLQILGTGVNGTFVLPEMIVIAIPNTDRTRDMTPTHVLNGVDGKPSPFFKTSGGMANFLQFIKSELIPKVEGTYRAAPYRVLVGHSLGGITAINALYTVPETFNAYVAIDPSLWWDNRTLLREAKARVSVPGRFANRALYVAQANTINAPDTTVNQHFGAIAQFDGVVRAFNQSGLRYGFKYYGDDDHGSVPLIAEYDALRFIFDGYKLPLMLTIDRPEFIREHFARVSAKLGYEQLPPESMLETLGRITMGMDTTKALAFFTMNTELYPNSAKAHASLGDGWAAKGDTARAVAAYERALAIRPANAKAKEAIRKLRGGK